MKWKTKDLNSYPCKIIKSNNCWIEKKKEWNEKLKIQIATYAKLLNQIIAKMKKKSYLENKISIV